MAEIGFAVMIIARAWLNLFSQIAGTALPAMSRCSLSAIGHMIRPGSLPLKNAWNWISFQTMAMLLLFQLETSKFNLPTSQIQRAIILLFKPN